MKTKFSILAGAIIIMFNFCSSPIDSNYFDSIKKYSLDMNHMEGEGSLTLRFPMGKPLSSTLTKPIIHIVLIITSIPALSPLK